MNLSQLNKWQQQFLTFLYGAAISVLLARVFIHEIETLLEIHRNGILARDASASTQISLWNYIYEVLFLFAAITYVSIEWLARRASNLRLIPKLNDAAAENHPSSKLPHARVTSSFLTVTWILEILGILTIILTIGNFVQVFYGDRPAGYLPHILFAIFALLTFCWEALYIVADPVAWAELVRESFYGSVSSMKSVNTVWRPWFRSKLEKVEYSLSGFGTMGKGLVGAIKALSLLLHQYMGQHIVSLNLWFFIVIVLVSTNCNGQSIIGISYKLEDMRPFWLLASVCLLTSFLLFLVEVLKTDRMSNTSARHDHGRLRWLASTSLIGGILLLHLSLSPDSLVVVVAAQQFLAILILLPAVQSKPIRTHPTTSYVSRQGYSNDSI